MRNYSAILKPRLPVAFFARQVRPISYALVLVNLMVVQLLAQDQTVSGKVVSAKDNAPLPGVNIVIKGSSRGTVTDMEGSYRMDASPTDVLVFSQIGLKTVEVTVGQQTVVDVSLEEDTKVLGEVVVTALGISQEKRTLGYSVQEVKGNDLVNTQRSNFLVSCRDGWLDYR
jgi:hypothetical protein